MAMRARLLICHYFTYPHFHSYQQLFFNKGGPTNTTGISNYKSDAHFPLHGSLQRITLCQGPCATSRKLCAYNIYIYIHTHKHIHRVIQNDCMGFNNLVIQMQPHVISFYGVTSGSGLCSFSSREYPGTEGTNQNRHWNHHSWHATNSWNELDYRVDVCRITKGAHIEHL